ncbi:FAD-binding oxidoreductase [Planktomarina sp.]|nr:FAD-binding oxidoreductase [Planktomarina sp.]
MLNEVTAEFEHKLRNVLPNDAFLDISTKYLIEPRGRFQGKPGLVVAPKTTKQVSYVVEQANLERIGIVPFGGGTGLVGGQVLDRRPGSTPLPIIISLERMNSTRCLHPKENVITVDAGTILSDVQSQAAQVDQLFPLSLASKASAQIGGLLATNAGGVNVLRYGMARDQVLGLEAVMADGQIFNGLSRLRKDNSGYDLRHLLIGSEGSLGIITAASLKLVSKPKSEMTALLAVKDPETALKLLNITQGLFGESVSAFELISGQGLSFLYETFPSIRQPWPKPPAWSVLLQLDFFEHMFIESCFDKLYEHAGSLLLDGVKAQSLQDSKDLWAIRETIPLANTKIGSICSHDISLPLSEINGFVRTMTAEIQLLGPLRLNCFGHLGDGSLHFNIFPPAGELAESYEHLRMDLYRSVHQRVHKLGGSISAEHGIGRLKVDELEEFGDPTKLNIMRALKKTLDPKGILNPGAVLRPQV